MYPSYLVLKLHKRRFDSSGVRHRNAMTEKACEDTVQGLGKVGSVPNMMLGNLVMLPGDHFLAHAETGNDIEKTNYSSVR